MRIHDILVTHLDSGRLEEKKKPPSPRPSVQTRTNEITYDSKFNKMVAKFLTKTNRVADVEKVDKALDQLKSEGQVTDIGGIHAIKQPIYSEKTQTKLTGWNVIPISRKNDLRLAYKNHGEGVVEVKFGRAEDIGYKH